MKIDKETLLGGVRATFVNLLSLLANIDRLLLSRAMTFVQEGSRVVHYIVRRDMLFMPRY